MRRTFILLIVTAFGLAACGGAATDKSAERADRACTPPRAHWLRQASLGAGLGPGLNHVSVDRNGAIYVNGHPSSLSRMSAFLSDVAPLNPRPFTFLETEMGAPCALVERVRDEMERRLDCRGEGSCAEGIWTVWDETPSPPGTPPS
jgi:hypothetical protein